ncbi:MAG: hypothetical protein U0N62_05700, partial [Hydrogeniiclostridium sp.]
MRRNGTNRNRLFIVRRIQDNTVGGNSTGNLTGVNRQLISILNLADRSTVNQNIGNIGAIILSLNRGNGTTVEVNRSLGGNVANRAVIDRKA